MFTCLSRRFVKHCSDRSASFVAVLLLVVVASLAADPANPAAVVCTETAGPTRALGLFQAGEPVSLEDGFRNPPAVSRAKCWWQSHGSAFTKESVTYQLEEFKAKGMGGVTIKDTLSMPRDEKTAHIKDLPFMSPQWLDLFGHIAAECKRLGLVLRCRLGSGWNEGGPWITPRISSQDLALVESKPIVGPARYAGPIPMAEGLSYIEALRSDDFFGFPTIEALRSGEAFVVAVRDGGKERIDVTDRVSDDRKLTWNVPKGTWTLVSCFSKPAGYHNFSTSPSGRGWIHDHMSKSAADVHLDNVPGRMLAKLGTFQDSAFDGVNTDSWELGTPNWTPGFRKEFTTRRGYDPVPYLPVLAMVRWTSANRVHGPIEIVGKPSAKDLRFLFDYRTTVSDLIIENFCRHVQEWCHRHGIAYESEAGGPARVPRDMLQGHGAADIPMGEFWLQGRMFVKVASSAAHAYGRRLVSLESLTDTGTSKHHHIAASPASMKQGIDEAFLLGGNHLTMASVEYSPIEAGLPGWVHNCGPHLNPNQTWWPLARPFFDYIGRCSFLLQSGHDVAQVALYRTFRTEPDFRWCEERDDLSHWPKEFAFDYVGDELVQEQMSVRDGRITLSSGATYEVLCIDPTPRPTMPLATLKKIRDLIGQGATVVWLAQPPERCPGLTGYPQCDVEFQTILKELRDAGRFVVLPKRDLACLVPIVEKSANPAAWKTPADTPLRFVHRRTSDADIFFVVNRASNDVEVPVTFRIKGRSPELWDPDTGVMEPAVCKETDSGVQVPVRLAALGATFLVFREKTALTKSNTGKAPAASLEPIEISGPWQVEFPKGSGAPPKATFPTLKSWTEMQEPGIRHFSGIVTYRTMFQCPASVAKSGAAVWLDLGQVVEVCEVRLNGKLLGTAWHPPYRFRLAGILRSGENQLEIRVANLWQNRLIGDALLPRAQRVSRMFPESQYDLLRSKGLLESGLLGPVRILETR